LQKTTIPHSSLQNINYQDANLLMSLTPLSHSVVALSDAFHLHNPLFIKDIKALVVLNGFDCIVTTRRKTSILNSAVPSIHVLPISKCEIVGIVRFCQIKGNGSISLIIDDGSGAIDAIFWTEVYSLNENTPCSVGDLVRVRGNINVLSLEEKRFVDIEGKSYEGRTAVREIYVTALQSLEDTNEEALHWLICMQFKMRLQSTVNEDLNCSKENSIETELDIFQNVLTIPVRNGLETFQVLPNEIQNQISSQDCDIDTAATNDWFLVKYYGKSCKCRMEYKDIFIYCFCIATKDENDPEFMFRDALLEFLMKLEAIVKPKISIKDNTTGTDSNENDILKDGAPSCIQFNFSGVYQNPYLQSIAMQVTKTRTDENNIVLRLFKSTFRALRKDGIIYLNDVNHDIYLLLTRDSVLVPTMISQLIAEEQFEFQLDMSSFARNMKDIPKLPYYMESLPHSKLQLVRRLAAIKRKEMDLQVEDEQHDDFS
jgi:hypothetical protein